MSAYLSAHYCKRIVVTSKPDQIGDHISFRVVHGYSGGESEMNINLFDLPENMAARLFEVLVEISEMEDGK